jgi:hypothetical protein
VVGTLTNSSTPKKDVFVSVRRLEAWRQLSWVPALSEETLMSGRVGCTWAPTLRMGQHHSAPRFTTSNIAMATRQTKTQTVKTSEATQHQEHVMLLCPLCEPGPPSDFGFQFFRELLKARRGEVVRDEVGKAASESRLSQQIIERHE